MLRRDWRDAKAYDDLLEAGMEQFIAWEFLTRNPEYLEDVAAYERDIDAWMKAQKDTVEIDAISSGIGEAGGFFSMQIWEEEVDDLGLDRGPNGWYCKSEKWLKHFKDRWQLQRIIPPSFFDIHGQEHSGFDGAEFRCFFHTAEEESETYKLPGPRLFSERLKVEGPRILLPVDLSLPLEELERTAVGLIRYLRKKGIEQGTVKVRKSRLLRPAVYVEHLRILDAMNDGATIAEIGEVLHPCAINDPEERQRDKRIRAAHKAALKMRAEGWRVLAGVPE